jgi:hypothetical protein
MKFDIQAGNDILDPIIDLTGTNYNLTTGVQCPDTNYVFLFNTYPPDYCYGYSCSGSGCLILNQSMNNKYVYSVKSLITWSPSSVNVIYYYADGTINQSGYVATGGSRCLSHTETDYNNPFPEKRVSNIVWLCFGNCDMWAVVVYPICANVTSNSTFSTLYPKPTVNITYDSGCYQNDVLYFFLNGTTLNGLTGFSNWGSNFTVQMNETNCSWINFLFGQMAKIGLKVNIFNTNGILILENITTRLSLDNGTLYQNRTDTGMAFFEDLNPDSYTLELTGTNYLTTSYNLTSEYFLNFTGSTSYNTTFNAFLISNVGTALTTIKIITQVGQYVDEALITITGNVNGTWQTITQKTTDSTGTIVLSLEVGKTYRTYISKSGYVLQQGTITPTGNPYDVVLILYKDIVTNITTPMSCIDSFSFSPTQLNLNNTLRNFTTDVLSLSGNLEYFGVYYNASNLTNLSYNTGGVANLQLNLTSYSGILNIMYFFKCYNQNLYVKNVSYYLSATLPTNNATFEQGMADINSGSTSFLVKMIIILITIVVALLIAWEIGMPPISYGFIVTIVLCFFTFYPVQWIPQIFTIVGGVALVGGSLYAGQGGEMYG